MGKRPAGESRLTLSVVLLCTLLAAASCGTEPEPLLKAGRLIGSTPEQLIARLGEPQLHRAERGPHFGALRWADIDSVEVLVIIANGTGSYVSYQFVGMEPFDEAAALKRVDVILPKTAPEQMGDGGARRWEPCGEFVRLTINPATKLVSIGSHPWRGVEEETVEGATAGPD